MEERIRRVGASEGLFRTINEKVKALNDTFATFTATFDIICERGNMACLEHISMTADDYTRLRSDSTLFAIIPGHEIASALRLNARGAGADVVHVAGQLGDTVETVYRTHLSEYEALAHADRTRAILGKSLERIAGNSLQT